MTIRSLMSGLLTCSLRRLHQQVEDAERLLPLLTVQPPEPRVDDLERAGERHAEPPRDFGQAGFGPLAQRRLERRPCRNVLQDRAELDLRVDAAEGVDALLQALGDGQ